MIGGSNIIKHINLLGKKVDEGGQTNSGKIAEKALWQFSWFQQQ